MNTLLLQGGGLAVLLLVSLSMAKALLTSGNATSLSPESNLSTQPEKSGLRAADKNQSVATTVVSGGDMMQRTPPTARPERNRSLNLSDSTDTVHTSGRFVSGGKKANVGMPFPQAPTTISTLIPFTDSSVTWRDNCGVALCETGNGAFVMNSSACSTNDILSINSSKPFTVTIVTGPKQSSDSPNTKWYYDYLSRCEFNIASQRNHYISFTVGQLSPDFNGKVKFEVRWRDEVRNVWVEDNVPIDLCKSTNFSFLTFSPINVHYSIRNHHPSVVVNLYVNFKEGTYVHDLPVVMLSDTVGYLTSPGFQDNQKYPDNYDGVFDFEIANNSSILINIIKCSMQSFRKFRTDYLAILRNVTKITRAYCIGEKKASIVVVFRESIRIHFHTDTAVRELGFKMMFAILPRSHEPMRLSSRLYNCSVPSFNLFSPVFSCNNVTECEAGEDCAQRNDVCDTESAIDKSTTCFSFVFLFRQSKTWFDAQEECTRRGQILATLENPEVFRQFQDTVNQIQKVDYYVGAQRMQRQKAASISALYKNIWQWVDGRTVFSVQIFELDIFKEHGSCAIYDCSYTRLISVLCSRKSGWTAIPCEFHAEGEHVKSLLGDIGSNVVGNLSEDFSRVSVIQCPSDHVTRDFLFCDPQADCDVSNSVTSCRTGDVTVPMFVCQRSQSVVHYTLVCDHMQHCPDNADEDFCHYPECSSKCRNGQCIHSYQYSDGKFDCYDLSDEISLPKRDSIETFSPPGLIHLDGRGNFRVDRMNHSDVCPPTHFLCPRSFCLPVYLRCNGIDDCMGREDEVGCDIYKCRGFYRCRGSKICLHADNVCDNVPQCPEQDDELLCNLTCPHECRCQGLAFVCTSNISTTFDFAPRYLDASDSNMTINNVRDNIHLIALRLSMCHIVNLPADMPFPNMRELDISWNKLHRLHMNRLLPLKNLRVLVLTGNPLIKITNSKLYGSALTSLERIDLSYTRLEEFSGSEFSSSPTIKILNISWSKLRSIAEDSFRITPRLERLDMRGIRLAHVPNNLLRHLSFLKIVHAENHKLCCEAMLPIHFDLKNCYATYDLLASCDDLLKSNTYRVFMWIFAALSLVGNAFSIGARLYQHREAGAMSSYSVFVINLSMADLFMEIYLAIVGTADLVFRGRYLWHDEEWKKSTACNIAGFFCLLSSETSAFIICIITLDRFLVLRFPFGRLYFGRRSALVVSGVMWVVGISLAILPVLPVTTQWEFYSQTGICIPLPFTSSDHFRGYHYSFGVSILLNLFLFLLIVVGQAVVYWAVRANSIASSTNKQARDATIARRLTTVVVSDFLCWFPIGLLGLLASTGTPIPGELSVAVATFVLPVNSALNPFLYTFNLVMEKRRKVRYEQLLKRLELERRDHAPENMGKSRKIPQSANKDVVIQQIKVWIGEQVLTPEDLLSFSPHVSGLKLP